MKLKFIRLFALVLALAVVVTACDTAIPTPPPISVAITVVSDPQQVGTAVAAGVEATHAAAFGLTATFFAQGGVTFTPSPTFTPSFTPTLEPTRFTTATPTLPPSPTPSPTFAAFPSNTPAPQNANEGNRGWVRVLHAWRDLNQISPEHLAPLDVYLNDERVSRELTRGEQTNYFQVIAGAVRVTLRVVDDYTAPAAVAPLLTATINVPPGQTVALVISDMGNGLGVFPITEDAAPLSSGLSRLTLVQANRELLPVNIVLTQEQHGLAYNFSTGQQAGAYDVPSGVYNLDLYDVLRPDLALDVIPQVELIPRLNYVVALVPYRGDDNRISDYLIFAGSTRLIQTDVYARFINVATRIGRMQLTMDNQVLFSNLAVGDVSAPVPIPLGGNTLVIHDLNGQEYLETLLGPWDAPEQGRSDKLIIITDVNTSSGQVMAKLLPFPQNPPRSNINASVRLIHSLPDTVPLTIEMRPVRTEVVAGANNTQVVQQVDEARVPWVLVDQTSVGTATAYKNRQPDVYDVRIVPSGSRNVLYTIPRVELKAGGIYDFLVLPGKDGNVAQVVLLEPQTQVTNLAADAGDPAVIAEAVAATLTAQAPQVTNVATQTSTPTNTPTPLATNTPRPTVAFSTTAPIVLVDPAAPTPALGTFNITGLNFTPGKRVQILWEGSQSLATATVEQDGTFVLTVAIPPEVTKGTHAVLICNDCRAGGAQEAVYSIVVTG